MKIEIAFTEQPLLRPEKPFSSIDGAVVEFWGVVRNAEAGQPISGLRYEIYEPMARHVMQQLLEKLGVAHPCTAVSVVHRFGLVAAGEASIFVRVTAKHRAEAFRMLEQFMTLLKSEVPIWKVEAVPC